MEAHGSGTELGILRCPAVGIFDHQMYVHRQIGDFADALDDRLAQRQVRDEMMVHHIDMNQIRIGDGLEVTLKIAEVGGQDARCDFNAHNHLPYC